MPWERRRYRRNKVWVEVDERGALVLDDRGLAALRYKPDDSRTYTVRPDELGPVEATPSTEETAAEGPPVPSEGTEGGIVIYTDGASSGNPGPAGLGVLMLFKEHRREIQRFLGKATNNHAELEAVLVALRAVKKPTLPVAIHTDSEYVIGVLTKGHKVKANTELVAAIQTEMTRFPNLSFIKVPAHAGVAGNERADRLARDAIRTGKAE